MGSSYKGNNVKRSGDTMTGQLSSNNTIIAEQITSDDDITAADQINASNGNLQLKQDIYAVQANNDHEIYISPAGYTLGICPNQGVLRLGRSANNSLSSTEVQIATAVNFTNSTIVNTVTAMGDFMTCTVNGSAVAIPLYIY